MKHVLLLGDSIRQNYQQYVRIGLNDCADVRFPNDNCRFSAYTLRYIYEWINALSRDNVTFDIIHFNVGLWDVLRLSGELNTFTSKEEYKKNLERIYFRIKRFSRDSKIIFALSTKVIEPGFALGVEIGQRKNEDIIEFNNIARNTFEKTDVIINDLWTVSEKLDNYAHSDSVHYDTERGRKALGDKVIEVIKENL